MYNLKRLQCKRKDISPNPAKLKFSRFSSSWKYTKKSASWEENIEREKTGKNRGVLLRTLTLLLRPKLHQI